MVVDLDVYIKYLSSMKVRWTTVNILLCVRGVLRYQLKDEELSFNLGKVILNLPVLFGIFESRLYETTFSFWKSFRLRSRSCPHYNHICSAKLCSPWIVYHYAPSKQLQKAFPHVNKWGECPLQIRHLQFGNSIDSCWEEFKGWQTWESTCPQQITVFFCFFAIKDLYLIYDL